MSVGVSGPLHNPMSVTRKLAASDDVSQRNAPSMQQSFATPQATKSWFVADHSQKPGAVTKHAQGTQ